MQPPDFAAFLVGAKRLHKNISKVQLKRWKGSMLTVAHVWIVVTFIALLVDCTCVAFGAAAGKGTANQRGAKTAEQMSTKGGSNSNAQWSADPVRGWVRADERHKMQEKTASSDATKQNDGKQKGKGKKF